MNANEESAEKSQPVYEPEDEGSYTLETIATLSGIDSTTILRYRESGLIRREYDSEALRRIRCIHRVETEYEAGPSAVKLILALYDELEELREMVRRS